MRPIAPRLQTEAGCFLKGTGPNKHLVVSRGALELNGLEIIPDPGSTFVIDADKLRLDSVGAVSVVLRNAEATVTLFHGEIGRDLSTLTAGTPLFEFPHDLYVPDVLGFDTASGVSVELTRDGVRIPLELKLPGPLGAFTGKAVLVGNLSDGLVLDSLHFDAGPLPLGVMDFEAHVDWKSGGSWTGTGKLTLPAGGTFDANVAFEDGDFKSASFNYSPQPALTVGPFVYLTSIGGGLTLSPDVQIQANATLGSPAPLGTVYPVQVHGQFTMTFPKTGPASFRMDGSLQLFMVQIADGYFQFKTNGYADFHGAAHLELGPLSGGAEVNGFIDPVHGTYGADLSGQLQLCVTLEDPTGTLSQDFCAKLSAAAAVSSIGFAACARFDPPDPFGGVSAGLAVAWDDLDPGSLVNPILATTEIISDIAIPCNTDKYRIPPPGRGARARAAARANGQSFQIPGGQPTATLLVPSASGTPDVTVTGPDGSVLHGPDGTADGVQVVTMDGADALWVVLTTPAAGTYTVVPDAGSPALEDVQVSAGFSVASVKGTVKKGAVHYATTHLSSGQKVLFRETGKFGTADLGTVAKPQGTFHFKPSYGPGGKRTIQAVVLHDGIVQKTVKVGTYQAPEPKGPPAVRKVHATFKGTSVLVSFTRPHGASRVDVSLVGSAKDKASTSLRGKARKARLTGFKWDHSVVVTIKTFDRHGLAGPTKKVKIKR